MTGTAPFELGMGSRLFLVASITGTVGILVMIGHEETHGVAFTRTRSRVTFLIGTGNKEIAVRCLHVMAELAVNTLMRGMIEGDGHTRRSSVIHFNGILQHIRDFSAFSRYG